MVLNLFEELGSHLVGAVKDDEELLPFLHLLEQGPGVRAPRGQLADADLQVVLGRRFDQLLHPHQTFRSQCNNGKEGEHLIKKGM